MNPVPCVSDAWMVDGACYRSDTTVFFDDDEAAKQICARCKVADLCAGYALTVNEKDGVWGGMDERERRNRRRRWQWRACKWRKCRRLYLRSESPATFFCSERCRDARQREHNESEKERQQRWRDV